MEKSRISRTCCCPKMTKKGDTHRDTDNLDKGGGHTGPIRVTVRMNLFPLEGL